MSYYVSAIFGGKGKQGGIYLFFKLEERELGVHQSRSLGELFSSSFCFVLWKTATGSRRINLSQPRRRRPRPLLSPPMCIIVWS